MVKRVETATVKLWGNTVGALAWLDERGYAIFEYDPNFLKKDLDIAPIHMSLDSTRTGDGKFSFPTLSKDTFLGLLGLLADALPDKFGNSIIDAWLARNGRVSASFSPVESLCHIDRRGMGALEFEPATMGKFDASVSIEVSDLVALAQDVMKERKGLKTELGSTANDSENETADVILDILRVSTSAGGARPKAVIAMDKQGNVRSGQAKAPADYDYWLLKFDGVTDLELGEPRGYGRIEFAYYLMAKAAGIKMTECRLLEENGRAHFMTKRFDRVNYKASYAIPLRYCAL